MSKEYRGWSLYDKVTIWYKTKEYHSTGFPQGYIADPTNANQMSVGKNWARTYEGKWIVDPVTGKDVYERNDYEGECVTLDNKNFKLTLLEAANDSSQGGKLSFWNCLITKDGQGWVVGISSTLLLDLLKNITLSDGVVAEPLMFARCKAGVGMLAEHMQAYKDAQNDMQRKAYMSSGKTSKFVEGNIYESTTLQNVYLGEYFTWFEPIYEERFIGGWRGYSEELVGYRKLKKPIKKYMFPHYEAEKTTASDYIQQYSLIDKKPSRKCLEGISVNMNISRKEIAEKIVKTHIVEYLKDRLSKTRHHCIDSDLVGLSDSDKDYTMPEEVVTFLSKAGYRIEWPNYTV